MAIFAYRALTSAGARASGIVDAASEHAAWNTLRDRGLRPTRVALSDPPSHGRGRTQGLRRAEILRQMSALLRGGVALPDALAIVQETAPRPLATTLATLAEAVREGTSFADACRRDLTLLDEPESAIIAAGEAAGTLSTALRDVAADLERRTSRRRELRRLLTYPAILLVVAGLVLVVVQVVVLPEIASLFSQNPSALPLPTRLLLAANDILSWTWPIGLISALAAGVVAWRLFDRPSARNELHHVVLRMPILGAIARDVSMARFADGVASMLGAGLPLDVALRYAADAAPLEPVRRDVRAIRLAIVEGRSLREAIATTTVSSPALLGLIAAGEEAGDLTEALREAAIMHDAAADHRIRSALALLEPALVVAVAAIVFALVWAVLVPFLTFDPMGGA